MYKSNERMNVIAEAALIIAKSKQVPTSIGYALAREIYGLWWEEYNKLNKEISHE